MLRWELPGGRYLRLFEESDAEELDAVIAVNRAYLGRWLPWAEAVLRQAERHGDTFKDIVVYSMLAAEWSASQVASRYPRT
jgi:hypothetical protein